MTRHNANNERVKRRYFSYLKEARRYSEPTVDSAAKAIARFELDTGYRDFRAFHIQQAISFKRRLADTRAQASGGRLSKATQFATCAHLKRFFQWLADQPGYRSRLGYSDAEYFNVSENDVRIATARRERPVPTLEQVIHVISSLPTITDLQRRDQAIIAFTLLTGARDSATASLKLKHIDLAERKVVQDAREVATKRRKTITTYFLPVGDDVRIIVEAWVRFLRVDLLWGNDDPLFPATLVGLSADGRFEATGLARAHWKNAGPIRTIFKNAFAAANLPYFNPHSLRNTLAQLGERVCRSAEEFKAWSQNLGHESVLTTLSSYGAVSPRRQGDVIRALGNPREAPLSAAARDIARAVADELRKSAAGTTV